MKIETCFRILALAALALPFLTTVTASAADPLAEADALLNSPTLTLPQAQQALALYESQLPAAAAGTTRTALLVRLARVSFIIGDLGSDNAQRQPYYEKGKAYAETLLGEQPAGVEGHYWLAMNLAGLADTGGMLTGRRLLPELIRELQRSLAINEAYDHAGAHRVLGRIYYEAPRTFSVGDLDKSRRHLAAAVRLAPECSTNHLYYAETLLKLGETAAARRELEAVQKATVHGVEPPGLQDDRREAQHLLKEMGS